MTTNKLIIFTRYPEAGKAKTRLIPALGAEGAATLQRQMTEYVIGISREAINQVSGTISIEVHFAGGNQQLMAKWLGNDIIYRLQSEGDIGLRMSFAFQTAFNQQNNRIVIIGSDCPQLNSQLIIQAFDALSQNDLVLGPATDGGYYLIGLRRFIPELFTGISWSTSEVLQQTIDIAKNLNLAVDYLETLSDVDRPEDLYVVKL